MALRGLLYRKLVEKEKQAGEKPGKVPAKKIPVPAQKVSILKRFLKRPRENDFVPAKYTSSPRRAEAKEKNLIQNKMAVNSPNDNMALDLSSEDQRSSMHRRTSSPSLVHKQKGEMVKGRARYWGGHFLYPVGEAEKGELMIQNGTLTFVKSGFSGKRSMNIPVKKIDWKKVSQIVKDTAYPVTCFSIPFRDGNGIIQTPVFSVDESPARENLSRFLYERMTKKK